MSNLLGLLTNFEPFEITEHVASKLCLKLEISFRTFPKLVIGNHFPIINNKNIFLKNSGIKKETSQKEVVQQKHLLGAFKKPLITVMYFTKKALVLKINSILILLFLSNDGTFCIGFTV